MRLSLLPVILAVLVPYRQMASTAKELPQFTDKAFVAKFQVVITEKKYHTFAVEKYDETQKKTSLNLITGDKAQTLIMDYADQTITALEYSVSTNEVSSCYIASMDKALDMQKLGLKDNFHFFGGWRKKGSKNIPHMFSSKSIFTLNTTKPIRYVGPKTLDGIPADYWTTSMEWTDDKDTFDVNYYFTQDKWTPAESSKKRRVLPLRIEVKGKKQTDTGAKSFHHYYEYLDFSVSDRLDPGAFDIPGGSYCNTTGKINMTKEASMPDAMSYGREVIDSHGTVTYADVIYDKKMGLLQISAAKSQVLYDVFYGVRYEIKNGKCITRAIDRDLDVMSEWDGGYVKGITPPEISLLKKSSVYMGPGHSRNIGANIFGGSMNTNPFDAYFGKSEWNFLYNAQSPPISLNVNGKHYNIFNFQNTSISLRTSRFLTRCKRYKDMDYYEITFFSDDYIRKEDLFSDDSIAKMADAIADQANLDKALVSVMVDASNFNEDSKKLNLICRIYSAPSQQYLYREKRNRQIESTSIKSITKTLPKANYDDILKQSASLCETTATGGLICRNFDLCENGNTFTLRMYETLPSGVSLKQSSTCNHYSRSAGGDQYISMDAAISKLQDSVKKGFLYVKINNPWREAKLYAVGLDRWFRSYRYYRSSLSEKFTWVGRGNYVIKKTETIRANYFDCANLCLQKGEYSCKSIMVCYGTEQCILSADLPQKGNSSAHSCGVYKRRYIADFKPMPGFIMKYRSPNVYNNVEDANGCAQKCMENKDYNCESFDYCKDTKECMLKKEHAYNVPADRIQNESLTCTHFSKNYLLDFDMSESSSLSSDDAHSLETLVVSAPEQCAYICRTGYGGKGCVQFDYCSDKKMCQIASASTKSYVSVVGRRNCDTYTLSDVNKVMASGKLTGSKGTSYSDASFGGLAFAMVLVGLALGVGIIYALYRQKKLPMFLR